MSNSGETETFLRKVPRKKESVKFEDGNTSQWEPPPGTWDENLPYGGKVVVARRKKPISEVTLVFQVFGVISLILFVYYSIYNFEDVVFRVHHVYALLGHSEAQHQVGQRYLQGIGVRKSHTKAAEWLKLAAKNGHPEASYNLAVGHLKGHHTLDKGYAHKLLVRAAKGGVNEAQELLKGGQCRKGGCN